MSFCLPRNALITLLLLVLPLAFARHAYAEHERYSQLLVGELNLKDSFVSVNLGDGEFYRARVDDLPILVGAVQEITGRTGVLEYGWEGGVSFSWQSDSVTVSSCFGCGAGGATIRFTLYNDMVLLGTHLGGLINLPIGFGARFYASAGPMLTLASLDLREGLTADNIEQRSPTPLQNQRRSSLDLGWYAVSGVAFDAPAGWEFGFAYRVQDFNVNFSDSYLDVDYSGSQLMFMLNTLL